MKTNIKKILIISLSVLLSGVMLAVVLQSTKVSAQKNYIPSVTNLGSQSQTDTDNKNTYKVNQNGQRYGSTKYNDIGMLDLVMAKGTNGESGYVKASDLDEPAPKTLEEAANRVSKDRSIHLYAEDGTTIIGEFIIKGNDNGNVKIYK